MSFRVVVARSAARRPAERLPEPVAVACVEFIFGALPVDPAQGWRSPAKAFQRAMARPSR